MYDDDPYATLGLDRDAGVRELKSAYRALSLAWHPDRHAHASEETRHEAERRFKQIHAAYLLASASMQARCAGPPVAVGGDAAVVEAIRAAVAIAALRLLAGESHHTYRRVVDVAGRVLRRAVAEGDLAFGAGLEPPLQAAMWAVGMNPSLRPAVVRVLMVVTCELPYRGEGPAPEVWLASLAPLERALREAPIE